MNTPHVPSTRPGSAGEPRRLIRRMLGAALALAACAAYAAPKPYTAQYEVLRNGSVLGRGTVSLQPQGDLWQFSSVTQGTEGLAGLASAQISERSTVAWRASGPETREYRFSQSMAFSNKERSVQVDPDAGSIVSRDKKGEHRFPYQPGVLDRNALTLALIEDVAAGKRGELSYPVVDRARLEQQRFRIGATETVDTPAGPQEAVRVERIRDSGGGRTTTVWLGAKQGYLPVRLVQEERDGDRFEMRLVSVTR